MKPTPAGVPVKMMSPGSSGTTADSSAISCGTPKTRSLVRASCTVSPSMLQPRARSSGSSSSSGVTTQGPSGAKPRCDLPRLNWPPAANCSVRSDRSWPTVSPATCDQASAAATRSARRPTTTTSSTSQSTVPLGSSTSAKGPVMQAGNLVNVAGTLGTSMPDSAAWDR